MLKGTNYWDTGYMNLYLNNKPTRVYVPPDDPKKVYELSQAMIADDGKIPIGIDHLPEAIIKQNPILKKLDLLHVGDITAVELNKNTNSVEIIEASFTNPLIQELYDRGELEAVSIVSEVSTHPCPRNHEIPVITTEKVKRVDIVGVGACETCRIPIQSNKTMVYARKPIMEEKKMSEENNFTREDMTELLNKQSEQFQKQIEEMKADYTAKIDELKSNGGEPAPTHTESESVEIAAMQAKIDELEKQAQENQHKAVLSAANARVDLAIQQGKVLPAQKESMIELAASRPESFDTMIKNAPVIVDVDKKISLVAGYSLDDEGEDPEPTDDEKNMNNILEANKAINGDD